MILLGVNIPDIMVIMLFEGGGAMAFLVFWMFYNKNKFTVLICESYLETLKIKKKMKVSLAKIEFKWGKFAYHINFKHALIDNKGKPILYYKYELAEPIIALTGIGTQVDSQVFKIVTDGKIMGHMSDKKMTKTYMYLIFALIVVIGIVSVFSIFMMSQDSKEITSLTREILNITKSAISGDGTVHIP